MKRSLSKIKYLLAGLFLAAGLGLFASCTSEIEVELKKDGSVDVKFNGSSGNAFAALNSLNADTVIFDTKEIEYEMAISKIISKINILALKNFMIVQTARPFNS